jgi:phage-related protein
MLGQNYFMSVTEIIQSTRSYLRLINDDNESIDLRDKNGIYSLGGSTGLGSSETDNSFFQGANYNEYQGNNWNSKNPSLELTISAKNRREMQNKIDETSQILYKFTDYAKPKPLKLVYGENMHTPKYELEVVASGGFEWQYSADTDNNKYIKTDIQLKATAPAFKNRLQEKIFLYGSAYNNGSGLLSPNSFAELKLNNTVTSFNNYSIDIGGSFNTYPIIETNDPVESVEAINNDTNEKLMLNFGSNFKRVLIDFEKATIIDKDTNETLIQYLTINTDGTGADFFILRPGKNTISFMAQAGGWISKSSFGWNTRHIAVI